MDHSTEATKPRVAGSRAGPLRLDPYAERLIGIKARQLVGRYGFLRVDVGDIEQDLRLDLLRRLPRFDPARASRRTFIARVIDHAIATIIERQTAACRDGRLTRLFTDCGTEDEEGKTIPFEFDAAEYLRLTGRVDAESPESINLRADLERVVSSLPWNLQALCKLLLASPVTEISRRTGIPRATLYERIREVRSHFERAGLQDYCSFVRTPRRIPVRSGK